MKEMNALAAANESLGRVRMEVVPGVGHNSAALTDNAQEVLRNLFAGRVSVPDVVGMNRRQAMVTLERASLRGRIGEPMLSDRPEGEVVLQVPSADSWAAPGSNITLNLSAGVSQPDPATVPDVVGRSLDSASSAVRAAGFTPQPVPVDSPRPALEVVGQSPSGGERAAPGSEVRLFISRGTGDIR